jgi:membrane protein YqaA with SNARE-associated domain
LASELETLRHLILTTSTQKNELKRGRKKKLTDLVRKLQTYIDRWWYSPVIAALALADNFLLIIPTDGILISSSMLRRNGWVRYAFAIAMGSTLGALMLAHLVELKGLPWILELFPGLADTKTWSYTTEFFEKYGVIVVGAISFTPFMQQPAVVLAGLANIPITKLLPVIFFSRLAKYLIMSYIGSHAPRLIAKMWGLKGELEDAGVKVE